MTREGAFSDAYHLLVIKEERRDRKKNQDEVNDAKLKGLVKDFYGTDHRLIPRAKI